MTTTRDYESMAESMKDKVRLVRDIRRSVARWPKGLQYEYANWKWRPSWWIARRYSHYELLDLYRDVEFPAGDDDDPPP